MRFKRLPKQFVTEMVNRVTILVNSLPRVGGVHDTISARQLVTGNVLQIPACKIGEYVHGHVPTTNDTGKPRAVDGLYLGPNNNGTGHYIFKLGTKQPIKVPRVTKAPVTDLIINFVNKIGKEEIQVEGIEFLDYFSNVTINDIKLGKNSNGMLDNDNSYDDNSNVSDNTFELDEDNVAEEAESNFILDEAEENINGYQELQRDPFNYAIDEVSIGGDESKVEDEVASGANNDVIDDDKITNNDEDSIQIKEDDDSNLEPDENNNNDVNDPAEQEDVPRMAQELESNLNGGYWDDGIAGALVEAEDTAAKLLKDYLQMNASFVTPQYGSEKGLKIFGNAGYDATEKELRENLIGCNCIKMLNKNELIDQIRKDAVGYLLLLKRKRCRKVKARGCVDGRPQQSFITKEESTTPTISLHALMATCLINALEGRNVMCMDVPGAFLQASLEEGDYYYVKFTGKIVDMLYKINDLY